MNKVVQLKKLLSVCILRSRSAEIRLNAALMAQKEAEEAQRQALYNHEQEIQEQDRRKMANKQELLSGPIDPKRLTHIRLDFQLSIEKILFSQSQLEQKIAETRLRTDEAVLRRQEFSACERRKQKIETLIEKNRPLFLEPEQ